MSLFGPFQVSLQHLFKRFFLFHALADIIDHVTHFIESLQLNVNTAITVPIIVLSVVAVATAFVFLGDLVQINQCEKIAGVLIVHGLVKGCIFSIDVGLANCVLALTEDGHQNEHVLEGVEKQRCHQQLAVSDVDWDVDVKSAKIGEEELVVPHLQATAELQRFNGCIDVFEVWGLNGRSEHFSWVSEDGVGVTLMQQFNPEDDLVQRGTLNLGRGIIWQFLVEGLFEHSEDDSIADATRPSCALVAAGLAGPNQLQILHPAANIEANLLAEAEVDHISDSQHGDGRFSDIGGDDDFKFFSFFFMQFVSDLLVEDGRVHVDHVKLSEQPLGGHEAGQGVTQSLDFSQSWHEDEH